MKGTRQQLLLALDPLGDYKKTATGYKFNCSMCESAGNPINKYNLEIKVINGMPVSGGSHCWCCNYAATLYKTVLDLGHSEYAPLFKQKKQLLEIEEENDKIEEIFSLPESLTPAFNNIQAKVYLISRGITKEIAKEREVQYCYFGPLEGCLIFPSTEKGKLTSFVSHNLKTKRYKNHRSKSYTGFYLDFIDKRFPIIIAEGLYDVLPLPNSLPLLGMTIKDKFLDEIAGTDVLLFLDNEVKPEVKDKIKKKLQTTINSLSDIETEYKDPNEFYVHDKKRLVNLIEQYYK